LWRSQFPRSFFEMSPFGQSERGWAATTPAVDVTENRQGLRNLGRVARHVPRSRFTSE
jgi:hypothetical protein